MIWYSSSGAESSMVVGAEGEPHPQAARIAHARSAGRFEIREIPDTIVPIRFYSNAFEAVARGRRGAILHLTK
jgi:hypothetical protein